MINGKHIAVVFPAYNAEKTLEATVRELPDLVDVRILVDDHSSDRTLDIAHRLGLQSDAVHLPFRNDAVDCVFSNRLLHHILPRDERAMFLREFHRVSKRWVVVTFSSSRREDSAGRVVTGRVREITQQEVT